MDPTFVQWFEDHNGRLHPNVEIASGSTGNFLRLKAGCKLEPEAVIVSCPHSLTISWLNVIDGVDPFMDRFNILDGFSNITKTVMVRFFLVEQYLLREQSLWWPFIRSLPQPYLGDCENPSLWYDEDDLKWLRGTNLGYAMGKLEKCWVQEYDEAIESLNELEYKCDWSWLVTFTGQCLSAPANLQRPLYRWAAMMLNARCFPSSALANNKLVRDDHYELERGAETDSDSPVLIPGIDLANHKPSVQVKWMFNETDCGFISYEKIEGGGPIWNNYGNKANEQLIIGYRFSTFRNPWDCCNLAISSRLSSLNGSSVPYEIGAESKPIGDWNEGVSTRASLAAQLNDNERHWVRLMDDQDIRMVRLQTGTSEEDYYGNQTFYEFSAQFLQEVSSALFNQREITKPDRSLQSKRDFSGDLFSRNKLNVLCTVTMKLQKQYTSIIIHDKDLPQWPRNDKQFHAARYRRTQLQILKTVTDALLATLRILVGLNPNKPRNVQVVRLENILMDSPPGFRPAFRAALNAGLGTRKPAKIREKQWVECAFTLWLCGLWLWDSSGLQKGDPRTGTGFEERISQWLCFVRKTYGESPDANGCVYSRNFRLVKVENGKGHDDSDAESDTPSPEETACNIENEDYLLAESFLGVVKEAVKKNRHSIYNHSEVNVLRLMWCLHIIRQEGFMCPNLEGKTGDDNDEFLLFLELDETFRPQSITRPPLFTNGGQIRATNGEPECRTKAQTNGGTAEQPNREIRGALDWETNRNTNCEINRDTRWPPNVDPRSLPSSDHKDREMT